MELKNIQEGERKKKLIKYFLEHDILLSKDLLEKISEEDINELCSKILTSEDPFLLHRNLLKKEKETKRSEGNVKVVFSYQEESKKREIQDFVLFFNKRYEAIKNMLYNRQELQNRCLRLHRGRG